MAAPVEQVGVIVACPSCGTEVLQKTMIPLGVVDGVISYACVPCARKLVTTGTASG
jgi:DNA-directed RNA polymerase subunit RPC12/RpoP